MSSSNADRKSLDMPMQPAKTLTAREVIEALKSEFFLLSPQLQSAARFIIDNPGEVAVHSMRSIAKRAGVQHNAMIRLARELGFSGYDEFRDLFRTYVTEETDPDWIHRAKSIRERFPVGTDRQIVGEYIMRETQNLQRTFDDKITEKLDAAVTTLRGARRIFVLGVRSMFSLAYHFHYTFRMFDTRTVLLSGLGGSFADDLRSVHKTDALVVFSNHPYAMDTIRAVTFARARGVKMICITDSEVSPIIGDGDVAFIVTNNSVSLFPSLVPALSVVQILATLSLSDGGTTTMQTLERTQEQLDKFGVYMR